MSHKFKLNSRSLAFQLYDIPFYSVSNKMEILKPFKVDEKSSKVELKFGKQVEENRRSKNQGLKHNMQMTVFMSKRALRSSICTCMSFTCRCLIAYL